MPALTDRGLSVSRLVGLIQDVVESNFVTVAVEGEVSNFAAPASGHWYMTLKDDRAQIRAVMFRGRNRLAGFVPENGMQVSCTGSVSVYTARGEMQLVIDALAPAGVGSLQAAFELLKARLDTEGLFALERKRPMPPFPQSVGVVTSATGAAIHDILTVLRRRAPGIRVLLRPVKVQGEGSVNEIVAAIDDLNRHGGVDVLIVGRGGGSLEDLWSFNEEAVARAIAGSALPVISAVGHEVDVTIADLVADLRAPTPSAAAEMVAKSRLELEAHLDHLILRLQTCLQQNLTLMQARLDFLGERLDKARRLFRDREDQLCDTLHALELGMERLLRRRSELLGQAAVHLDALSPLKQLDRGFAIASHERDGVGIRSADSLATGDSLWLRFASGRARTRVEEVES